VCNLRQLEGPGVQKLLSTCSLRGRAWATFLSSHEESNLKKFKTKTPTPEEANDHPRRGDNNAAADGPQPRASGPGLSPGWVSGRFCIHRHHTVAAPTADANGPAMGGERAGLGVLGSHT
jgi:hypothetical protein